MFYVSRFMQSISYDDDFSIIWHALYGNPMVVSKSLAESLESIKNSAAIMEYKDDPDSAEYKKALKSAHILIRHPVEDDTAMNELYRLHNRKQGEISFPNKAKYLSLIMSEECPFRCKYCIHFANSKHYYNQEKMMPEETAKHAIDYYLKIVKDNDLEEAYINFGGGEPLLNWQTIEKILPYIDEQSKKLSIPVKLGINTNLSLLTKEMAQKLVEYNVEIAASLDGTKNGNDVVRLDKNLNGTYEKILKGFQVLAELGHPLDGFAMTVTEDNFFDIDTPIIDWAHARNMHEVRIDIDVVGMINIPVEEIAYRLIKVRRYAKSKGISVIGFWSRPAENLGLDPEEEDIGFCGGERGNSLCVAPSGQVFPCGYSNYELGTVEDIPNINRNTPYQLLLYFRNLRTKNFCIDCPILGFCRGGCMITQEANKSSTEKMHRMCELYRSMTYAILRESAEPELET